MLSLLKEIPSSNGIGVDIDFNTVIVAKKNAFPKQAVRQGARRAAAHPDQSRSGLESTALEHRYPAVD